MESRKRDHRNCRRVETTKKKLTQTEIKIDTETTKERRLQREQTEEENFGKKQQKLRKHKGRAEDSLQEAYQILGEYLGNMIQEKWELDQAF